MAHNWAVLFDLFVCVDKTATEGERRQPKKKNLKNNKKNETKEKKNVGSLFFLLVEQLGNNAIILSAQLHANDPAAVFKKTLERPVKKNPVKPGQTR